MAKGEVEFTEKALEDGRIEVRWNAATPRDWRRILTLFQQSIPNNARRYQKDRKTWLIAPDYLHVYEDIKRAILTEDKEVLEDIDERLSDETTARIFGTQIRELPPSMRRRANFAVKAALGMIDAPVEYCISEGKFAAWNASEGVWNYEDGRYSTISPSVRDTRAITNAHKRLQSAIESVDQALEILDTDREIYWKNKFRAQMLEKYEYRCYTCGGRPASLSSLHMHRVTPGHAGGMYVESNVVILCVKCHSHFEGDTWSNIHKAHEQLTGKAS